MNGFKPIINVGMIFGLLTLKGVVCARYTGTRVERGVKCQVSVGKKISNTSQCLNKTGFKEIIIATGQSLLIGD